MRRKERNKWKGIIGSEEGRQGLVEHYFNAIWPYFSNMTVKKTEDLPEKVVIDFPVLKDLGFTYPDTVAGLIERPGNPEIEYQIVNVGPSNVYLTITPESATVIKPIVKEMAAAMMEEQVKTISKVIYQKK